ncbi:2-dehydro-3-deoxy-phosphogluconate aldolase [Lacrimispora indolis]|uniref:2-dehydro-3-deoxy-phosphogluconate aldolase n=1 Tax=Lacrimispora indolis TaxID=69825 RepID=UPI00045E72BD|nr:KDGP aldolase family protein [Lacrimispora indolis]MBE7720461.1 oxo-acid lyase [Lacrimispora celerecrescens]
MEKLNFYKGRVCLNCLTNSVENARAIYEAAQGHVAVGILSADYPDVESAVEDMKKYQAAVDNNISVGLGAGNPGQWKAVAEISGQIKPKHINQTFTAGGYTRAKAGDGPFINSMVAPCGKPGYVKISTGPLCKDLEPAVVPVKTAIAMAREQGADSLKYFPMGGLKVREELEAVAKACKETGFGLEPTGGIDLENFKEILEIAVDAGVELIIPHVYSSIIDKETGATRIPDVLVLYEMIKEVVR